MKKKVLIFILIIVVVISNLTIGASAYNNTSNITVGTPEYTFSKTGPITHRNDTLTTTSASGSFYSYDTTIAEFFTGECTAKYTVPFTVNADGYYTINYSLLANYNADYYQISIYDNDNFMPVYTNTINDTSSIQQTKLIVSELSEGKSYTLKIKVNSSIDGISLSLMQNRLFNPLSYTINYSINYSSTGSLTDDNTGTSGLVLEKIDSSGKYWYRFNGFSYKQNSGSATTTYNHSETSNSINASFVDLATYYASGRNAMLFNSNIADITVPITGSYQIRIVTGNSWAIKTAPTSTTQPLFWYLSADGIGNGTAQITQGTNTDNYNTVLGTMFAAGSKFSAGYNYKFLQLGSYTGCSMSTSDFKMYLVLTPTIFPSSTHYDTTYNIENTDYNTTNFTSINNNTLTVHLPDENNVFNTYTTTNYTQNVIDDSITCTITDGSQAVIVYGGTGVTITTTENTVVTNYYYNYYGVDDTTGTDGVGDDNIEDAPEEGDDTTGTDVLPTGDGTIWNFLMDLLGSLFSGILSFLVSMLTGIWDIITSFLGNAAQAITGFFTSLSPDGGAFSFFNAEQDADYAETTTFFAFMSALFYIIPLQIQMLVLSVVALFVFIGLLKMVVR